jgi:hypothetical protein
VKKSFVAAGGCKIKQQRSLRAGASRGAGKNRRTTSLRHLSPFGQLSRRVVRSFVICHSSVVVRHSSTRRSPGNEPRIFRHRNFAAKAKPRKEFTGPRDEFIARSPGIVGFWRFNPGQNGPLGDVETLPALDTIHGYDAAYNRQLNSASRSYASQFSPIKSPRDRLLWRDRGASPAGARLFSSTVVQPPRQPLLAGRELAKTAAAAAPPHPPCARRTRTGSADTQRNSRFPLEFTPTARARRARLARPRATPCPLAAQR